MIAEISLPIAEIVIPKVIATNQANSKIEPQTVIAADRTSKC